jgi:tetratricopeptide (TPR) repeat protein
MQKDKIILDILILFFLITIPLTIFWQSTSFGFVQDDELVYFTNNSKYYDISFDDIRSIWKIPDKSMYIPVSFSVWALLKQVGKFVSSENEFDPYIFHFANVILHILNGLLIFLLLNLIFKNRLVSFMGAMLFLVHPVQVEAVMYISEMRGLLANFLGFSFLYCYLISSNKKKSNKITTISYIFSLILFTLSVLSKPSTIILPIIAIILEKYIYKNSFRESLNRIFPFIIVIILPLFVLLRPADITIYKAPDSPVLLRPFIWFDAINFYLHKIIYPISFAPSYARTPGLMIQKWWLYLEWIITFSLGYLLWKNKKKHPILFPSFIIFIVGFLPVSGLAKFVFQNWSTVADRYIYISMLGISMVFSYFLSRFRYKSLWYISLILLMFLSLRSGLVQVPIWKNKFTLWNHCIKEIPTEEKAYYNRAFEYKEMGKFTEALKDYDKAISINPFYDEAYNKRGNLYREMKKYQHAINDYNKAIRLYPDFYQAYLNRGLTYAMLKMYNEAIIDISKALQINPFYQEAFNNRGNIYAKIKKYEKALEDYDKSLEIDHRHAETYNNKANVYASLQEFNEALENYNKAIKLNPDYTLAYQNRAAVYYFLEKFEKALEDIRIVKSLNGKIDELLLQKLMDITKK